MKIWSRFFLVFLSGLVLSGCGDRQEHGAHGHSHSHDHQQGHDHHSQPISMTRWGAQTELFMEFEPLVMGKQSSFLIHLTRLSDFSAVTEAEVTLLFTDEQGEEWKFLAAQPLRDGIFQPLVTIQNSGKYAYEIKISGPQVQDSFAGGTVEVYSSTKDIEHTEDENSKNKISFLKEQQWLGHFLVEVARPRELSPVIRAQGEVRAPVNATIEINAVGHGHIVSPASGLPLLGASVQAGQTLAMLEPATGGKKINIVSPVAGVIALTHVRDGDVVEKGWKLFEMIDLSKVWVVAEVYEPDVPQVRTASEAIIQVPGTEERIYSNVLVSMGATMDQASRTLPIIFEVSNEEGFFKVGASLSVEIKTGKPEKKLAIPRAALVDVDGKWMIYVQVDGESFEERSVSTGVREGDWVEITKGIRANERVVTKGAYTVRLAASSSDIPTHSHH